jgi:hypothetical protein
MSCLIAMEKYQSNDDTDHKQIFHKTATNRA